MLCFDIKRLNAWLASLTTVLTACEGFKRPPSFFKSRKFDDIGSLWFKKFRQSPHFSFDFICFQLCMLEYHLSIRLNCSRFLFKYRFIHSASSLYSLMIWFVICSDELEFERVTLLDIDCVEQFPNLVLFVAPNIIFL